MLTAEQHEFRKTGIGGSDAASICSLWNPKIKGFLTPLQIYLDKLGMLDAIPDNQKMYAGRKLEPVILDMFEEKYDKIVIRNNKPMRSEKYPWMIANIDGWIENENAGIDAKNACPYHINDDMEEWGEDGTDQMPLKYMIQCAHYRIVSNASRWYLTVLLRGYETRTYIYEKNDIFEQSLINQEKEFWYNFVLNQTPPPAISAPEAAVLHPHAINQQIFANTDIEIIWSDAIRKQAEINQLEEDLDRLKAKICNHMGACNELLDSRGNKIATWKKRTDRRFDLLSFKIEHPALYNEFLTEKEIRTFRLTGARR